MIHIIGAGPAGGYSAYLLAKAGRDVSVYEDGAEVGDPVQCTGIVTETIHSVQPFNINKLIINKITKVRIFSNGEDYVALRLKHPNPILDRKGLDQLIAEKAEGQGAKIFLKHRFMGFEGSKLVFKNDDNILKIKKDILIGADGPMSQVARSSGLFGQRKFMSGIQATLKLKNDNCVDFFPFIGTFAWIVPENEEIVRIGVGSYGSVKGHFDRFLKMRGIDKKNIVGMQGGLIPMYNPQVQTRADNTYLVGDAATQVKATTGGGIIQSLIAANCLATALENGGDYVKEWKARLGKELWLHLKIRKVLDSFDGKDWCRLVQIFNTERNKRLLEECDRDSLTRFFARLVIGEPRLLYFIKYLAKAF
ncbi:MAG TPA: NAD(P)/FAD-dependent oxidoreductase [Candidatus Nanoarchaeia archaeon]|nr:NAD(P)/FAD-dependent oxidoreductase [Candidatus Nanoarchaeia archaeon]